MMLIKKLARIALVLVIGTIAGIAVMPLSPSATATVETNAVPAVRNTLKTDNLEVWKNPDTSSEFIARAPVPAKAVDEPYSWRAGTAKEKLLKETGGNEQSEKAVELGLAWLAKQQKADGSWVFDGDARASTPAATGMALLPFLGAGETHQAGKYQKTVQKALKWLIDQQEESGMFKGIGTMYAQAIAAQALCEAYGMTQDKDLLTPAQAAIAYIQKAQGVNGSWGYVSGTTGDTSITGWQIQALHAAELTKHIAVEKAVTKRTLAFLDLAAKGENKAMYGYIDNTSAAPGTALTAESLLGRVYFEGWGPEHAGIKEGVAGLMKWAPDADAEKKPPLSLYFYYHATQLVRLRGGEDWLMWNEGPKKDGKRSGGVRGWLIELQDTNKAQVGSWNPDPSFIGRSCGRLGTTALCVLTLEVYYRYPQSEKLVNKSKK